MSDNPEALVAAVLRRVAARLERRAQMATRSDSMLLMGIATELRLESYDMERGK